MATVYRNLFAMGTRFDLVLPDLEEEAGDYIFGLIKREIFRLQDMLSNYNELSNLSVLNKTAFTGDIKVDEEMFDLAGILKSMYSTSFGYFDVCAVSYVMSEPGVIEKNYKPAGPVATPKDIILDEKHRTIRFDKQGMLIDSGGFGKGYALEKVKKILLDHNILHAFISFGESSVLALGDHPFGEGWKVSIPDSYASESVCIFHLKDSALSVSGNTPANKNKYPLGHIINPKTGIRESCQGIVCISGPSAFAAEILSTSLFLAGNDEQQQILKNFEGYKAVRVLYDSENNKPSIQEIVLS